MNRRTLLGTLSSAAILALTGCLGDGGSDDRTPDETDTPPTITDTEFEVIRSQGGTQTDTATVATDGTAVAVDGTIWGRNGCQTAELAGATYDSGADELTVAVATTRRDDAGDVCTQGLVELDYAATVAFENGTPGTVVVTHSRGDTTETVTTVSP
jgi:hypothetical protein